MKRDKKDQHIQGLDKVFQGENTFYLLDFKNMTVAQSMELRKTLRKESHSLKVVKNRLALKAMKDKYPQDFQKLFRQPTALAYTAGDPVGLARTLKEFSVKNKVLAVKGGILQGHMFPSEKFEDITKLASRHELLGRLAGVLAAPLRKFVQTWQAPASSMGRLLSQLHNKK